MNNKLLYIGVSRWYYKLSVNIDKKKKNGIVSNDTIKEKNSNYQSYSPTVYFPFQL